MDTTHRIPSLSITPDVERQTPRNDFGEVMAHAVMTGAKLASSVVGGMGGPILSAAVSAGRSAISSGIAFVHAAAPAGRGGGLPPVGTGLPGTGGGVAGTGGSLPGTTGDGSGMDLLEAQRALQAQGQQFNAAYLQLQDQMQRESREFNAVTNIMKVRHDSAKAAINNIH